MYKISKVHDYTEGADFEQFYYNTFKKIFWDNIDIEWLTKERFEEIYNQNCYYISQNQLFEEWSNRYDRSYYDTQTMLYQPENKSSTAWDDLVSLNRAHKQQVDTAVAGFGDDIDEYYNILKNIHPHFFETIKKAYEQSLIGPIGKFYGPNNTTLTRDQLHNIIKAYMEAGERDFLNVYYSVIKSNHMDTIEKYNKKRAQAQFYTFKDSITEYLSTNVQSRNAWNYVYNMSESTTNNKESKDIFEHAARYVYQTSTNEYGNPTNLYPDKYGIFRLSRAEFRRHLLQSRRNVLTHAGKYIKPIIDTMDFKIDYARLRDIYFIESRHIFCVHRLFFSMFVGTFPKFLDHAFVKNDGLVPLVGYYDEHGSFVEDYEYMSELVTFAENVSYIDSDQQENYTPYINNLYNTLKQKETELTTDLHVSFTELYNLRNQILDFLDYYESADVAQDVLARNVYYNKQNGIDEKYYSSIDIDTFCYSFARADKSKTCLENSRKQIDEKLIELRNTVEQVISKTTPKENIDFYVNAILESPGDHTFATYMYHLVYKKFLFNENTRLFYNPIDNLYDLNTYTDAIKAFRMCYIKAKSDKTGDWVANIIEFENSIREKLRKVDTYKGTYLSYLDNTNFYSLRNYCISIYNKNPTEREQVLDLLATQNEFIKDNELQSGTFYPDKEGYYHLTRDEIQTELQRLSQLYETYKQTKIQEFITKNYTYQQIPEIDEFLYDALSLDDFISLYEETFSRLPITAKSGTSHNVSDMRLDEYGFINENGILDLYVKIENYLEKLAVDKINENTKRQQTLSEDADIVVRFKNQNSGGSNPPGSGDNNQGGGNQNNNQGGNINNGGNSGGGLNPPNQDQEHSETQIKNDMASYYAYWSKMNHIEGINYKLEV